MFLLATIHRGINIIVLLRISSFHEHKKKSGSSGGGKLEQEANNIDNSNIYIMNTYIDINEQQV